MPQYDLSFIQRAAKQECLSIAEDIAQEAKLRAPVSTGRLRDSIKAESTSEGAQVTMLGRAVFPEFGTQEQEAQPFVRPAIEIVKQQRQSDRRA